MNAFVQARCRNMHEAEWVTAFAAGKLLGVTKARVHQLMKDHSAYQLECFQLDGTGQWLITRDSLERLAASSFGCSSGSDPTKATENQLGEGTSMSDGEMLPDLDEALLKALAKLVLAGKRPTAGEVLEQAKSMMPDEFDSVQPRRVSSRLKQYGLKTRKSNGRHEYKDIGGDQLRRIKTVYGLQPGNELRRIKLKET